VRISPEKRCSRPVGFQAGQCTIRKWTAHDEVIVPNHKIPDHTV